MALNKLSKSKVFHIQYCGCTAAGFLLNEDTIRDAINIIRLGKSKHEFIRTNLSINTDGIKLVYDNQKKFSTIVPSAMIGGSSIGKSPFHETVGVVYISPLTGEHYPAFVHVYRCDNARTAQKLLTRLRAFLLIDSHHSRLILLEKQLINHHLLNLNTFQAIKSQTINQSQSETSVSVPAINDDLSSTKPPVKDPIKSITEEFQKKIQSNQPLLFPPKDYDTIHANHGHVQRADAWKSTEPAIVGYSPIESDDSRNKSMVPKLNNLNEPNGDQRMRLAPQRSDSTADPVETVSLAFDFLKDETGSMSNENQTRTSRLDSKNSNDMFVYRFRPAQATAISSNWLTRNNSKHLETKTNDEFNAYYDEKYRPIVKDNRTRSETRLIDDYQPGLHLRARYGKMAAPISPNPIWNGQLPSNTSGSYPSLLSPENFSRPYRSYVQLSSSNERFTSSTAIQHPVYISQPNENFHQNPRSEFNRKELTQSQYLDTREFILRPSNEQFSQYSRDRYVSAAPIVTNRPQSMNVNGHVSSMLDVYY